MRAVHLQCLRPSTERPYVPRVSVSETVADSAPAASFRAACIPARVLRMGDGGYEPDVWGTEEWELESQKMGGKSVRTMSLGCNNRDDEMRVADDRNWVRT